MLAGAPPRTRVLIDETYVDYAGPGQSLESFAARSANVAVLKSLSKVYALSGARAAYLCAPPPLLEGLRALTPPWAVSLPGQIAAVTSLGDRSYYAARWEETRNLREGLAAGLRALGLECIPGVANFIRTDGNLPRRPRAADRGEGLRHEPEDARDPPPGAGVRNRLRAAAPPHRHPGNDRQSSSSSVGSFPQAGKGAKGGGPPRN